MPSTATYRLNSEPGCECPLRRVDRFPPPARKVWRELKIHLRTSETKALVAWFDRSTTRKLHASDLCDAIYGTDTGASSFQEKNDRQPPPLPPRNPHEIQAQKSASLANGESSCSPPRAPARTQEEERKRRPEIGDSKIAWNWQGRRGSSAAAGSTRNKDGGKTDNVKRGKLLRGGIGGGAPVRFGGVLQRSGEAVVAEKARIEKRLKELHRERALLLREKNGLGMGRCWEERGRRARTSVAPVRCGA